MKLSQEGQYCEPYCPECMAEEWIRPLLVRKVTPEGLTKWQADPCEDDLTRSAEGDGA